MNKLLKTGLSIATITLLFQGCQPQTQQNTLSIPTQKEDKFTAIPEKVVVPKPLSSKVSLTEFSVNKPLLFRPFNKSKKNKKIYFSFIGQTTDYMDIKSKIESNLKAMGYNIASNQTQSDIYIAIYMLGDKTTSSKNGIDYYENKTYSFNLILEQHIKGKTILAETYDIDGKDYGQNKSLTASAKLSANHSKNINSATTSMSDKGIGLFGSYSKGNKAMVSGKGEDEVTLNKVDTLAANHRSIKSETELDYYLFKDEVNIKAQYELRNMQGQETKANKQISDKLALRLAKLLDF
ncbi:MAG: hypothetical protein U9N59_10750 [Campylobacterota bacterium]|nr:hypothetical protein [Campylobacterota bacterium]